MQNQILGVLHIFPPQLASIPFLNYHWDILSWPHISHSFSLGNNHKWISHFYLCSNTARAKEFIWSPAYLRFLLKHTSFLMPLFCPTWILPEFHVFPPQKKKSFWISSLYVSWPSFNKGFPHLCYVFILSKCCSTWDQWPNSHLHIGHFTDLPAYMRKKKRKSIHFLYLKHLCATSLEICFR